MTIDIEKLHEYNSTQNKIDKLVRAERQLLQPVCTDMARLDSIFRLFSERNPMTGADRFMLRKQFLFIAVWLYSPRTLVNKKLKSGMRDKLVSVLGLRSPSCVSNEISDLLFFYERYRDFRAGVDANLDFITEELGI